MTDRFVYTRVLNAPRELVFKAYTQCEHLMHWWGPKGMSMATCKLDLRPGGLFHYSLRMPDGNDVWGKWVFQEIASPERLTVISSFSDPDGNVTRHPMAPNWPLLTLSTVTFTEENGRTTARLEAVPHSATEEERSTFVAGFESMQGGYGGTFDKFADYLARMQG